MNFSLTGSTGPKHNSRRLSNTRRGNSHLALAEKTPPSSFLLQEPPPLVKRTHSSVNNEISATAAILYIGKGLLETDENFSSQFILI